MYNDFEVILRGKRLGGGYMNILRSTSEPARFQIVRSGQDVDGAYFFISVVRDSREATEIYMNEVLGL